MINKTDRRVCDRVRAMLMSLGMSARGADALCFGNSAANVWTRLAGGKEWGVPSVRAKYPQAQANARSHFLSLVPHLAPTDAEALWLHLFYGEGPLPAVSLAATARNEPDPQDAAERFRVATVRLLSDGTVSNESAEGALAVAAAIARHPEKYWLLGECESAAA